ncbi:hypothetical protein V1525DRAFT_414148 [Lipomyces kononenkoae]|uniref:Uncharacterized protein n=1 Tax=Lipomyces kononenkoae TaxID=34357 RepID=A0ACC3SR45_LIPKO
MSITIRIQKYLHVRNSRRSQIVLAEIEKSSIACCPVDMQVVAKFFDPLFVSVDELPSDDAPAIFRRIVALRCWERESAAYFSLTSLQGTAVPKFYGQLACQFPYREPDSDQTVGVVLMEYIDGWPLSLYSAGELTESQARWIMEQIESIVHQIHSYGNGAH